MSKPYIHNPGTWTDGVFASTYATVAALIADQVARQPFVTGDIVMIDVDDVTAVCICVDAAHATVPFKTITIS